MKKILYIASEAAPGMIPFAVSIINTIARIPDYEVHCICVSTKKREYEGRICAQAHPWYLQNPHNIFAKAIYKFWPIKIINAINKKRKQVQPDILHFLTGDFTLALYLRLFADDSFYYTVHDLYPHEINTQCIKDRIIHELIVKGYKQCRDTIKNLTTSSQKQIEELNKMYVGKHIEYTNFPTLVNNDIIRGKTKVPELEGIGKYILFFGFVNKYKGVDMLIEAFSTIDDKHGTKLVIAGKGKINNNISNADVIIINRFIDDSELKCLFEKSVLVVYPYLSATMSGVLSIAYYFKKRMLLSNIPFFLEYASEDVDYFNNGDVSDLRNKLIEILSSDISHSKGWYYEKYYGELSIIDSYKKLYK